MSTKEPHCSRVTTPQNTGKLHQHQNCWKSLTNIRTLESYRSYITGMPQSLKHHFLQQVTWKIRISYANLDEVTCCGHFQLPLEGIIQFCITHRWTLHWPHPNAAPGSVMVSGQAAGDCGGFAAGLFLRQKGAKNTCWFFYQHPESSALKQNYSKSPRLYNTGILKSLLSAPHPAQASRERGETRNEPAQH